MFRKTMRMRKNTPYGRYMRALLLCAILCKAWLGHAQYIENHFTHYTSKEGLPDGPTYGGMVQDADGFLWLGTHFGMCRFDGTRFKQFKYEPSDSNSLRENIIVDCYTDAEHRMWVVTNNWMYLYHPEGEWFEHFGYPNARWTHISFDKGNILHVCAINDIYEFDKVKKKFSLFRPGGLPLENFHNYNDCREDAAGMIWLGCKEGLIRYNPTEKSYLVLDTFKLPHNVGEFPLLTGRLYLLKGGGLLCGTRNKGCFIVDAKTLEIRKMSVQDINPDAPMKMFRPGEPFQDVLTATYQLNDTVFLACCAGGLSVMNCRTCKRMQFIKPDRSDPHALLEDNIVVRSMLKDREGILWLAGHHSLEKYDFKDYDIGNAGAGNTGAAKSRFSAFCELYRCKDGKQLLGSYGEMSIYDEKTDKIIDCRTPLHERVNHFIEDDQGRIFCTVNGKIGIARIGGNRLNMIQTFTLPQRAGGFYDAKFDYKGRLLLATIRLGLVVFDTASKGFSCFNTQSPAPSSFSSSFAFCIYPAKNGCVWVGTDKGIDKIESDGVTVKWFNKKEVQNDQVSNWKINGITEDRKGNIWFTTDELGIGCINTATDSVTFFGDKEGLPTVQFDEIVRDGNFNLWISSPCGLLYMNTENRHYQLFTDAEGFPKPADINAISYNARSGLLYILTPDNILELDPNKSRAEIVSPPVSIIGLSVFDKERPVGHCSGVQLNYNENFINIDFASIRFHSTKQLHYAYKMAGVDKDWVYCGGRTNAPYTDLQPGTYEFAVKVQDPDGMWRARPTTLTIRIMPPLWQTWWFKAIQVLVLVATGIWIIRLYTQRRLDRQKVEIDKTMAVSEERNRIASDMHDDLGSGLTAVRMLAEVANFKTDKDGAARNEIEKILLAVDSLSQNLREAIWTMNPKFDKMENFISYLRYYVYGVFEHSTIAFNFNAPDSVPDILLAGDLRRNVLLCIKEALHNIMKHSKATHASLSLAVNAGILIVEIVDNGVGFDVVGARTFGNGLNIMKSRMEKYGCEPEIQAQSGTRLVFRIPIAATGRVQ